MLLLSTCVDTMCDVCVFNVCEFFMGSCFVLAFILVVSVLLCLYNDLMLIVSFVTNVKILVILVHVDNFIFMLVIAVIVVPDILIAGFVVSCIFEFLSCLEMLFSYNALPT